MKTKVSQSHRVGIQTRWLSPTNSRGSRVKAFTETGLSMTVPWAYELNVDENHAAAAQALADKYDWGGRWVGGSAGDGRGYVFVQVK